MQALINAFKEVQNRFSVCAASKALLISPFHRHMYLTSKKANEGKFS